MIMYFFIIRLCLYQIEVIFISQKDYLHYQQPEHKYKANLCIQYRFFDFIKISKRANLYIFIKLVRDLLYKQGFNRVAVAALMGNIEVETGGSFDYRQQQIGRSNGGYGLFQLDFQKNNYFQFCRLKNLFDSAKSQIEYVYQSIYGSQRAFIGFGNAKKIQVAFNGNDPLAACQAFCLYFQKPGIPHMDKRKQATMKQFNGLLN